MKALITIKGGMIESVHTTEPMEYVVVDLDNAQVGEPVVSGPMNQDKIVKPPFHSQYDPSLGDIEQSIWEELHGSDF